MTGRVAIDPERVRAAATHLRSRAESVMAIEHEIRATSFATDVAPSGVLDACAEIDEELTLLATILSRRADDADGFRLPGEGWNLESMLLGSLVDNVGQRARISGTLALGLVVDHRLGVVGDGDDAEINFDRLRQVAHDPRIPPEQAAAAAYVVGHRHLIAAVRPWFTDRGSRPGSPMSAVPLGAVERLVRGNELITRALAAQDRASGSWSTVDDEALLAAGVDPRAFDDLHLPRHQHDLLVAAIRRGAFVHSPEAARSLLNALPIRSEDGISIAIDALDDTAVRDLHDAATHDLDDTDAGWIRRWQAIARLPETSSGTRNLLFTQSYADIAHRLDLSLNGGQAPTDPEFRGHNWFHLGVVASDSVGPVIRGDRRVYALPISIAVRQEIADGNQAIFAHFTSALAHRMRGEPIDSPVVTRAFDLLDEARDSPDVAEAQMAVAESTALFALAEQRVVDPFLQLDALRPHERLGTQVISGITSFGTNARTAEEVMTDVGLLEFVRDGEPIREPISIGAPVPTSTASNNLVDAEALDARLPDGIEWDLAVAEDWSTYGERMPIIVDVAVATLTDPALTVLTEHHRSSGRGRDARASHG